MNFVLEKIGSRLARYLTRESENYDQFSVLTLEQLQANLQPGDLLLVEGNSKVSTAIKFLTQSTWSHICFYVGPQEDGAGDLIEADLVEGVIRVPLDKYHGYNLRICRPVNLSDEDRQATIEFVMSRQGYRYDTRNILDLMRYLLPTPPVPAQFRRHMIALGSGDPTRAICSTLVAQAFQSIRYPILPQEITVCTGDAQAQWDDVLLQSRHYSHFTPRDFDLSPYFAVIKPTITQSFNYKKMRWLDDSP